MARKTPAFKIVFCLTSLVFLLSGCAIAGNKYHSEKKDYSIVFRNGWGWNEINNLAGVSILYATPHKIRGDFEKMVVDNDIPLKDYVKNIDNNIKNGDTKEKGEIKIDNLKANWKIVNEKNDNSTDLSRLLIFYIPQPEKNYILIFDTRTDLYEDDKEEIWNVANTFKLEK